MDSIFETCLTRDQIVWNEGDAARHADLTPKDSPYRPGSADDHAWQMGLAGEHLVYGAC